jgi:hypothetical protein
VDRGDALFSIARTLEHAAYTIPLPTFDELSIEARSYLGAIFDFLTIDRVKFEGLAAAVQRGTGVCCFE